MERIALIPGDGVGPEVMEAVLPSLRWLDHRFQLGLTFTSFDYGAERYLREGVALPAGQLERFRRDFDAILLGAVGDPRVPDNAHAREILLGLRFGLDLYVNFRPCRLLDDRLSPLKAKGRAELDFVVFRENTEGPYRGLGGAFKEGTPDEMTLSEEVHTRKGVERIVRAAFSWARANGRTRVAMADKSNAIPAHGLWLRVFREVSREFPEVEARHLYVDNLAMQLVQRPEAFEVIVTNNLFGDILTDLGAALTGGLGVAPSANLNPEGDAPPLFEPVHGSAPDLARKGVVNPVAMFLSAALMLQTRGYSAASEALEQAVQGSVAAGETTVDLGGTLSTAAVAESVLERLRARG